MKIGVALSGIRTLFLDSAPIIYYVENVAPYRRVMDDIVARVTSGSHAFVTSSITLAECLIHPLRRGDAALAASFRHAITGGVNTRYVGVDLVVEQAAALRARFNLSLTDALQVAAAIAANSDAFLTNDRGIVRVQGVRVLVLDELEPD